MSLRASAGARGVDFVRHARGRLGKDEGTVPLVLEGRWGRVWNSFGFHVHSLMGQFGVELVLNLNWPQMVEFGDSGGRCFYVLVGRPKYIQVSWMERLMR